MSVKIGALTVSVEEVAAMLWLSNAHNDRRRDTRRLALADFEGVSETVRAIYLVLAEKYLARTLAARAQRAKTAIIEHGAELRAAQRRRGVA